MIVDLGALNQVIVDMVVEPFDHTFLNKDIRISLKSFPAENIAVHIRNLLQQPIRELGAKLHKVKLIESPNNSCEISTESELSSVAKSGSPA